ncbi:sigma 54-interacting transcriptional regulator [Bacillaceae bacterium S4-13-58]
MKNKLYQVNEGQQDLFTDFFVNMMEKIFDQVSVPMILIDKETRVVWINQIFADLLGYPKEEIIGEEVMKVDYNTRFPYVYKTKKPEIAWKHKFQNGRTAIVHRIPVLDENEEVFCGFGLVLFQDMNEFKDVIEKNKILESGLDYAMKKLKQIQGAKYSFNSIIGNSVGMGQALYMSRRAAQTNSNVLILGESGTGKELFAHAIHDASDRSHQQFVKINCAAIPAELLESELFGYDEGAFTGAKKGGKIGKFELANEGSIFLDEIGEMPLSMQAKLLRVLQEKEIERVGSTKTIPIDVRIIAATNQNLEEKVKNKEFRSDLYYRLNVMAIEIPPLRDREGDIEIISKKLVEKLSDQLGKYVTNISKDAMKILVAFDWPGNVRELENILERAINLADGDTILPVHLPYYSTFAD